MCKRAFLPTKRSYCYLLWVDGGLRKTHPEETAPSIERCSAFDTPLLALPHVDGFDTLKRFFRNSPDEPGEIDDWESKLHWRPNEYRGTSLEYLMWAPFALVYLPFSLPSMAAGEVKCRQMHRLRLGMGPKDVRALAKKLDATLGDPETYGIWVCTRSIGASGGATVRASIGFRDNEVVWFRYEYDAYADWNAQRVLPVCDAQAD